MMKYRPEEVIGNPCDILEKIIKCMDSAGFTRREICKYMEQSMSKDYKHFILVSLKYLDKCNRKSETISISL